MRTPNAFKCWILALALTAAWSAPRRTWSADVGTSFTYQGSLSYNGSLGNAPFDFRFLMFDSEMGGLQMGSTTTLNDVSVLQGVFNVVLPSVPASAANQETWLQVEVRPGTSTGAYTVLPRQRLYPAPFAVQLALPAQHHKSSSSELLLMRNTGTGSGATFVSEGVTTGYAHGVRGGTSASGGGSAGVKGTASTLSAVGVLAENSGSGCAIYATGQGQTHAYATLQAHNTQSVQGVAAWLSNNSNYSTVVLENDGVGETLWLEHDGTGSFITCNGTTGLKFWVDNAGTTHTKVLEILGGGDLSERFDVGGDEASIEPGTIVSIDPASEGRLTVSRVAYDRRVAGIISGAGGVRTGMLMRQEGSIADGDHPVALTGRVYCKATAANGPIAAGDLLTTSSVPGHAMRVDNPTRAQGAILGKAMGSLAEGEGLVLVLVGLQ